MGADFLITAAPESQQSASVLTARVDRMIVDDLLYMNVELFGNEDGEEDPAKLAEYSRQRIRAAIVEIVVRSRDRRDMAVVKFDQDDARRYYVTGGPSFGDSPTDAFDFIQILEWSGVTDDKRWVD